MTNTHLIPTRTSTGMVVLFVGAFLVLFVCTANIVASDGGVAIFALSTIHTDVGPQ